MNISYSLLAKKLKYRCDASSQKLTNLELEEKLQNWVNLENEKKGYLVGLSRKDNITKIEDLKIECAQCTKYLGHCNIAHILRNIAAVSIILELLEEDNFENKKEAFDLVKEKYEPYTLLREYTKRNCLGQWHNL